MIRAATQTFSQWRYVSLAFSVAIVLLVLVVWLLNTQLVHEIIFTFQASVLQKTLLLLGLVGSVGVGVPIISKIYIVVISILFGVNVALLRFFIKIKQGGGTRAAATLSLGGLLSSALGIGCVACGTFLVSFIPSLLASVGLLAILPFDGEEFGVLGIALLLYSTYAISKKINEPLTCES